MSARGFLLLRRDGGLWGVENAAVRGVAARPGGYRVSVDSESAEGADAAAALQADEVLGVVPDLEVWPVAAAMRRFWPEASGGLAVHGSLPVVIVDPRRPPRALVVALVSTLVPEAQGGDLADARADR